MDNFFSEEAYAKMIQELFCRFPSFQKVGAGAYKPGIANMEFADQLMSQEPMVKDRSPICWRQLWLLRESE